MHLKGFGFGVGVQNTRLIDSGLVGSTKGYHESRRCSRDTYPESYTNKHTSIRRSMGEGFTLTMKLVYRLGVRSGGDHALGARRARNLLYLSPSLTLFRSLSLPPFTHKPNYTVLILISLHDRHVQPLSDLEKNKAVNAIFRPWLEPFFRQMSLILVY